MTADTMRATARDLRQHGDTLDPYDRLWMFYEAFTLEWAAMSEDGHFTGVNAKVREFGK